MIASKRLVQAVRQDYLRMVVVHSLQQCLVEVVLGADT